MNDTQNTALGTNPNNSFQPENRVRCFTHTLNLGVKSFLLPFQPPEKKNNGNTTTNDESDADDDTSSELSLDLDDDDSSLPDLADALDKESLADDDGKEDVWDDMDEVEKADVIEQTKQAKAVISRVCFVRCFPDSIQELSLPRFANSHSHWFTRQQRHSLPGAVPAAQRTWLCDFYHGMYTHDGTQLMICWLLRCSTKLL